MNIVKNNKTTWFLTVNQQRFWLQSDNTVKEVRNTYGARMLSAMTQAGVWSTSSQNFLGVGHTHEDVDGVLSLCKAAMDTATVIHTPQDVASRLKSKLSPVFHARGIDLQVEIIGKVGCGILLFYVFGLLKKTFGSNPWTNCPWKVRDWVSLVPDHVTFSNAYKIRKLQEGEEEATPVPHSFIFTPRSSLSFLFQDF